MHSLDDSPALVIMDEPTGNLDKSNSEHVLSMIRDVRAAIEITVLITTHDPQVATAADRTITLADGEVTV